MKKKILKRSLLVGFLLLFAVSIFALVACKPDDTSDDTPPETKYENLEFTLSDDESYYILSNIKIYKPHMEIPSEYNGLPVKEIGDCAFYQSGISSVIIPDSIVTIGNSAFAECTNLTAVTIPHSVNAIKDSAFSGCYTLCELNLYATGTIGMYAFSGCGIKKAVIPEGITSIDTYAFSCANLVSITLPTSLTSLEDNSISSFKLKEVYNLSNINVSAKIPDCPDIYTSIDTPSKLTFTDDGLIFHEQNGKYTLIAESYKETFLRLPNYFNDQPYAICDYAFYGHTNIITLVIPDTITEVGERLFYGYHKDCTDGILSIFCEATSMPDGWSDWWDFLSTGSGNGFYYEEGEDYFWGGSWTYVNGVPTLNENIPA